jgi:hypothetical protein
LEDIIDQCVSYLLTSESEWLIYDKMWYVILIEFRVHRKIIGLMKMFMHDICILSMYLSDATSVHNGLKQRGRYKRIGRAEFEWPN